MYVCPLAKTGMHILVLLCHLFHHLVDTAHVMKCALYNDSLKSLHRCIDFPISRKGVLLRSELAHM